MVEPKMQSMFNSMHLSDNMQPPEESPVLDVLERFADLLDEMFDNARSVFHSWEGNVDRVAVRSLGRILSKFRHAGRTDRPPYALIVRLADQLPKVLADLTSSPKRVLQRQRAMESLEHMRELDSNCIRWIARQPGVSLAEKAGYRRSLLAVKRFESSNTLENRVLLSSIRLCRVRCRDYLRRYEVLFEGHERVGKVREFQKLCEWLIKQPVFDEVASLATVPTANYVLLHDQRYRLLWRAYLSLVRQLRRRTLLWQHRSEYYAELLFLAVQATLSEQTKSIDGRKFAHRHELAISEKPVAGSVFDRRSSIPIWSIGKKIEVWAGSGHFGQLPFIGERMCAPQNELVFLKRQPAGLHGQILQIDLGQQVGIANEQIVKITHSTMDGRDQRTLPSGTLGLPVDLFKTEARDELKSWVSGWIAQS